MKKNQITYERVRELLDYDENTGIFIWREDRLKGIKCGDIAGCFSDGYVSINIEGYGYKAHRLAWLYVNGYFPENDIDHIDRVRDNNRISNLREVSRSCNIINTGLPSTNTSGVKGVSWYTPYSKWESYIGLNNGERKRLGYFGLFEHAVYIRWRSEVDNNFMNCVSDSTSYQYLEKHFPDFLINEPSIKQSNLHTSNKSGVTGVCWSKASNKWCAYIRYNSKPKHLGFSDFVDECVKLRWDGEVKYLSESKYTSSSAYFYLKEHYPEYLNKIK